MAIVFNWLVIILIMIHTIKMAETKEELTTVSVLTFCCKQELQLICKLTGEV